MIDLSQCKAFLLSVDNANFADGAKWVRGIQALEDRITTLQEAIKEALADSESGRGWGPDVTICARLTEALGEQVL